MNPIEKEVSAIGVGIRDLRVYLGFSKKFVADYCGLTAETIGSIEAGKGFNHDSIGKLAYFYGMTISELTDYQNHKRISSVVREQVVQYLTKERKVPMEKLKEEIGSKTVIEKWLIDSGFFDFPRRVSDTMEYIYDTFNLSYKSATISQALINALNAGLLKRIPANRKDYYYLSSKIADKANI